MIGNVLTPILGAWSNWFLRGGGVESAILTPYKAKAWVQKLIHWKVFNEESGGAVSFTYGKPLNAVLYGVFSWLHSGQLVSVLSGSAGMYAGQAPGWGEYILAMRGFHPTKSIAWGVWCMTERGLVWGTALAVTRILQSFFIPDPNLMPYCLLCLIAGLLQGVIYKGVIVAYERLPLRQNVILNDWTLAEIIHGFLLWIGLIAL